MSARVAVLGAGGRIGSALLRHLSASGRFDAIGVVRNAVSAGPLRWAGLDVRTGSLDEPVSAREVLGDRDIVINCAFDTGWPGSARQRNTRLATVSRDVPSVRLLVQFSSVAVYGACIVAGRGSFERPQPATHYGREKLRLERLLLQGATRSEQRTVILRLGHVYGPYQWVSRAIFDLLAVPGTTLPFDGRLASNAVHVRAVCQAIEDLLLTDPVTSTLDLTDGPMRTWRELFDMHARAMGRDPVPAMDAGVSERLREVARKEQGRSLGALLARDLARWAAALPFSFVSSSPAARDLGTRVLAALQWRSLEQGLAIRYSYARARRALAADANGVPPWLLSDPVPGPALRHTGLRRPEEEVAELREWHASYSDPFSSLRSTEPR